MPAVRDWLTRKQKETWTGRAEIRLGERAGAWNAKPVNRLLPAWWEWLNIRIFTRRRRWTDSERKMMQRARTHHGVRAAMLGLVLIMAGWVGWEYLAQLNADNLCSKLLSATSADVPDIIKDMASDRNRVDPRLRKALAQAQEANDRKKELKIRLALLPTDPGQAEYLFNQLLICEPADVALIRGELLPYREELTRRLWEELAENRLSSDQRFRAACALALYAPDDPRWVRLSEKVPDKLLEENPFAWPDWQRALQPVKHRMLMPLAASLEENKWEPGQRRALIGFYRFFSAFVSAPFVPLEERLSKVKQLRLKPVESAKREANLRAALFALGKPEEVWPSLVHTSNPTLRSYLIERLGSSAVDPDQLAKRLLSEENDVSVRRALILALGAFEPGRVPGLVQALLGLYENDPDAGIHGASAWALRHWGEQLAGIDQKLARGQAEVSRDWCLTKKPPLHTFTIIRPRPSLDYAAKKLALPTHSFAVATTEVTVDQYRHFEQHSHYKRKAQEDPSTILTSDCPANMVSWYDAVEYCNWLSEREGIPPEEWCYRRNKEGLFDFVPDYLKRKGYRLPTDEEWEFACRAGAVTPWNFGEADGDLMSKYEWWSANCFVEGERRAHRVAILKPNDWGLFDMHGNVQEWCQAYAGANLPVNRDDVFCTLRGGFFTQDYRLMTCSQTGTIGRKGTSTHRGFRLVRTY